MTDNEKKDLLTEWLIGLYRIKAASKEDNPELDYQIKTLEFRLAGLGATNLDALKII